MTDPITDTPTSPPAGPVVPVGLATEVGLTAAVLQFAGVLVTVVLNGDHSQETIALLATATVTLLTVLAGRYSQARAAIPAGGGGWDAFDVLRDPADNGAETRDLHDNGIT